MSAILARAGAAGASLLFWTLVGCGDDSLHGAPEPPVPPEAQLVLQLTDPHMPSHLVADGSQSFDPDDSQPDAIAAHRFVLTVRPPGSAAALTTVGDRVRPSFDADREGLYAVELVVEDREGNPSAPVTRAFVWTPLDVVGDCVTVVCPPAAPNPVGCAIFMDGGDGRGCVAHAAGSSSVYLQEGKACHAGTISGALMCANEPGAPLNVSNCPINQPIKIYGEAPSDCPPPIDL